MLKILTRTLSVAVLTALLSAPSLAQAKGKVYKVDNGHSQVLFNIQRRSAGLFYGQFLKIKGQVTLTGKTSASVSVTVDANSVFTNSKKRDAHLRSPDFFNAKQFPKIKFSCSGRGVLRRYTCKGKLTFRGVTKKKRIVFAVTKPSKDPWGNTRIGATAKLSISRKAFGMKYMSKGLGDKVSLIISLELIKAKK